MELVFKLEKETKNYVKYRQVGGINSLYLPKPPEGVEITVKQFTVEVPDEVS
jgi:hypothetical protein